MQNTAPNSCSSYCCPFKQSVVLWYNIVRFERVLTVIALSECC